MLTAIPISETIRGSLLKLGVLAAGEELPGAEATDAIMALNRVVDMYNADGINISHASLVELNAPQNLEGVETWKSTVTLGKCMDYNMIPPLDFDTLFFRSSGGVDYPLTIIGAEQWGQIPVKEVIAIPSHVYASKGIGGSMVLNFNCIPQSDLSLVGYFRFPYTGSNDNGNLYLPTDEILWDFGIEPMLMYALALELADDYQVTNVSLIAAKLDGISQIVYKRNAPGLRMSVESSYDNTQRAPTNRAMY